jgi:hypothetical protein
MLDGNLSDLPIHGWADAIDREEARDAGDWAHDLLSRREREQFEREHLPPELRGRRADDGARTERS